MSSPDHERVAHFIGTHHASCSANLSRQCRLTIPVCEGGNSLGKAPLGRVHDFVKEHGGHSVITKVRSTHFDLLGKMGRRLERARAFVANPSSVMCPIMPSTQ